ncbi:MAG TPA: aminotransferase class I/II-fold pyridoxal phosphate-dependent enzyme, partial [Polyangiaceae bacterium]|nr:aminotransferase class I/II-fold pyridoxal phosphate-dependent enzyme [Polyangiaceae bacterium]
MSRTYISKKAARFSESVIREMTRLAQRHQAVNLAQGFPDYPAPAVLKDAAKRAIDADKNQYAITWGAKAFRDALAKKHERFSGMSIDPERELTVCCGSTEAMISALLATVDPGEEVIVFEPWYENYGPDAILSGAEPVYVKLRPVQVEGGGVEWRYDSGELRAAFSARTKGIIVNTPHNPTGKVFSRAELLEIGALCQEFDALIFTDEIYEHILYDGEQHVYPMSLPGLRERTVMISGLSKTFSITGWRIGYAIAPPEISAAIRKVHDFLTVGAPAPLQEGAVAALELGTEYYDELAREYQRRRDLFLPLVTRAGFVPSVPRGAYYVMAEYPDVGIRDDVEFTRYLIEKIGVAVVPASSFYRPGDGEAKRRIRFCYPKRVTAQT